MFWGGGGVSRKQGEMYAPNSPGKKMDTGGNVCMFGGERPPVYTLVRGWG